MNSLFTLGHRKFLDIGVKIDTKHHIEQINLLAALRPPLIFVNPQHHHQNRFPHPQHPDSSFSCSLKRSFEADVLTCVRATYDPRQHESTELRCTVSYLPALLTCFRKRFDTNWATNRMPRSHIFHCTVPHVQFSLQRVLISVPRIV
jgi:hypothetical protein